MAHIFISYSRKDRDAVTQLATDLEALGHDAWFDRELTQTGGQKWWSNVLAEIREREIFIFALTPTSLASDACEREYQYAHALNKPIVPVMLDSVDLPSLPYELQELQVVDFRQQSKPQALNLGASLSHIQPRPLPDPLPPEPETPMPATARLAQRLDAPSLSADEQINLLFELESLLDDPTTRTTAQRLMRRLYERHDVIARVAEKIRKRVPTGGGRSRVYKPAVESKMFKSPITAPELPAGRGGMVAIAVLVVLSIVGILVFRSMTNTPASSGTQEPATAVVVAATSTVAASTTPASAPTKIPTIKPTATATFTLQPPTNTANPPTSAKTPVATNSVVTTDELVVGLVLIGPKTDRGWSEAHFHGAEYAQSKIPGVTIKVVESLNPADNPNLTLEQAIQSLKEQGAKLIFTTSDSFQEDTVTSAKENLDITFINVEGDAVLKGTAPSNLGNVMGRMEYAKMIAGCSAALTTQKNHIAYLGPLINDETRRYVVSSYLGAKYCFQTYRKGDPKDLKFEVKWIGWWFNIPGVTLDPTEVTDGFYEGGADVVISGIDTTEVISDANRRATFLKQKVWAIPYNYRDACLVGPNECLGVPYFNWGPAYTKIISDFKAGKWKSSWDWLSPDWKDMNNPDTSNVGFIIGTGLPKDQKDNLDKFIADLASGNLNLFKGPINYQSGKVFLKDGEVATDSQIWYMPELVEGIQGESK